MSADTEASALNRQDYYEGINNLSVVIQAGGESRRMGQSKATVSFLGKPLLWRIVHRVSPVAGELIITTNEPENLGFLKDEFGRDDIILTRDIVDRRGALNGLYTALRVATKPYVAIVACDMIFASSLLIKHELQILERSDYVAAVPTLSHGYEPFHAVYRREEALERVKEALTRGETKANGWFDSTNIYLLGPDEVLEADPRGGCFVNVNTPEELAAMEERIYNEGMTSAADDM